MNIREARTHIRIYLKDTPKTFTQIKEYLVTEHNYEPDRGTLNRIITRDRTLSPVGYTIIKYPHNGSTAKIRLWGLKHNDYR